MGMSVSTPELENEQKVEFLNLQGHNIELLIKPLDEPAEELVSVDRDLQNKTQSQRMRSTLYVWWQQLGEPDTFNNFYMEKTERIIEQLKEKLE